MAEAIADEMREKDLQLARCEAQFARMERLVLRMEQGLRTTPHDPLRNYASMSSTARGGFSKNGNWLRLPEGDEKSLRNHASLREPEGTVLDMDKQLEFDENASAWEVGIATAAAELKTICGDGLGALLNWEERCACLNGVVQLCGSMLTYHQKEEAGLDVTTDALCDALVEAIHCVGKERLPNMERCADEIDRFLFNGPENLRLGSLGFSASLFKVALLQAREELSEQPHLTEEKKKQGDVVESNEFSGQSFLSMEKLPEQPSLLADRSDQLDVTQDASGGASAAFAGDIGNSQKNGTPESRTSGWTSLFEFRSYVPSFLSFATARDESDGRGRGSEALMGIGVQNARATMDNEVLKKVERHAHSASSNEGACPSQVTPKEQVGCVKDASLKEQEECVKDAPLKQGSSKLSRKNDGRNAGQKGKGKGKRAASRAKLPPKLVWRRKGEES